MAANLEVKITGDSSNFSAVANGVVRTAKTTQAQIARIEKDRHIASERWIKRELNGMTGRARAAINSGGAGLIGTAATGMAVKSTIDLASAVDDLRKKTGASAKFLQEWGFVAKQNGADMESVGRAFLGMSKARNDALENPEGDTAKAFAAVGIDRAKLISNTPEQSFEAIAKKFQTTDFGADEEALASKLLGRGGADLLASFKDDFQGLIASANEVGAILSDKVVSNLDRVGDAAGKVSAMMTGVLANALSFLVNSVSAVIESIVSWGATLGYGIKALVTVLNPFTSAQTKKDALTTAKEGIAGEIENVAKAWKKVVGADEEEKVEAVRKKAPIRQLQQAEDEKELKVAREEKKERHNFNEITADAAVKIGGIGGLTPGLVSDVFGRRTAIAAEQTALNTRMIRELIARQGREPSGWEA